SWLLLAAWGCARGAACDGARPLALTPVAVAPPPGERGEASMCAGGRGRTVPPEETCPRFRTGRTGPDDPSADHRIRAVTAGGPVVQGRRPTLSRFSLYCPRACA